MIDFSAYLWYDYIIGYRFLTMKGGIFVRKLPVYLFCDSGVDDFQQMSLYGGLDEWNRLFSEMHVSYFGSRQIWKNENGREAWIERNEYSSGDWFTEKSTVIDDEGVAVDAEAALRLLEAEPWQWTDPHIDLFVTSRRLIIPKHSFYPVVVRDRHAVQSVYQFNNIPDKLDVDLGKLVWGIKGLLWHALGHINGLTDHMTDYGCAMYHGRFWDLNAGEMKSNGSIYCPSCMKKLTISKLV